jgi:hypothetical protein
LATDASDSLPVVFSGVGGGLKAGVKRPVKHVSSTLR